MATDKLVEHGVLNNEQLHDFLFTNSVEFYSSLNADFFNYAAVEHEAVQVPLHNCGGPTV